MSYALPIVLTLLMFAALATVYRYLRDIRLRLQKIRTKFGPQHFSISYGDEYYAATQGLSVKPCIPTWSNPWWLIITILPSEVRNTAFHLSFTHLAITCRFFPLTIRRHRSPAWFAVEFNDFALQVYHSKYTPVFVQKMRDNLISALLNGDILRISEIKIRTVLDSSKLIVNPTKEARTVVTMQTQDWTMRTWKPRLYHFAKVDAHMTAGNEKRPSTLSIVALYSNYMQEPGLPECENSLVRLWWELVYFPALFVKFLISPPAAMDLRITRMDVTFDAFRFSDAELVVKGGAKARDKYKRNKQVLDTVGWNLALTILHSILS